MNYPADQLCVEPYKYHDGNGWTFLGTWEGKLDLWSRDYDDVAAILYVRTPHLDGGRPSQVDEGITNGEFPPRCKPDAPLAEARRRYLNFKKGDPNYKCSDPSISPNSNKRKAS